MLWCDCDELRGYGEVLERIVLDGREPTDEEAACLAAIERLGTDRMLAGERPGDELTLEERSARWQAKYRREFAEQREQKARREAAGVVDLDQHRRWSR
jgi:hypothetical protein